MSRFHAAVPVSGNRILVCGGCSAIGALQDVQIVDIGEPTCENGLDIAGCVHETPPQSLQTPRRGAQCPLLRSAPGLVQGTA